MKNCGFVEDCPKNHFAAASCCITKTGRDRSPALEKYALLQMLRLIVSEDPSTLLGMTGEHSSPLQRHPERSRRVSKPHHFIENPKNMLFLN